MPGFEGKSYVFNRGTSAIPITVDDRVYGVGNNHVSVLGIDQQPIKSIDWNESVGLYQFADKLSLGP